MDHNSAIFKYFLTFHQLRRFISTILVLMTQSPKVGRPSDWACTYFTDEPVTGKKYSHGRCRACGKIVVGTPERMLGHLIDKVRFFTAFISFLILLFSANESQLQFETWLKQSSMKRSPRRGHVLEIRWTLRAKKKATRWKD